MGLRRRECRAGVGRIDGPRVGDMKHRITFVVNQGGAPVAKCAAPHGIAAGVLLAARISGDSDSTYNGSLYADTGAYFTPADPKTQFVICASLGSTVGFDAIGFGGRWD